MAKSVSAGKLFQKSAIAMMAVATGAMFALGGASLFVAKPSKTETVPAEQQQSQTDRAKPEIIVAVARDIEKPIDVTLTSSTDKLHDLFEGIGYELDGVRENGEVPRVFIASLPQDLRKLPRAQQRKVTFIKSTQPLILHANELIEQDRRRIEALRDRSLTGKKLAPEDTAWGTSRFAREGNALFGQRAYRPSKKGIVPEKRPDGKTFRVRAFDHLIDGVKAYVHNLNSHFAYEDFRDLRATLRAETGNIDGYALAGSLLRYSERGQDYVETIRVIMRVNALQVFDAARLGDSVATDDDGPDA